MAIVPPESRLRGVFKKKFSHKKIRCRHQQHRIKIQSMDANITEEKLSPIANELRRAQLLDLTEEFHRKAAIIFGTTSIKTDVTIEIPVTKYNDWMLLKIVGNKVTVKIKDDSLPF